MKQFIPQGEYLIQIQESSVEPKPHEPNWEALGGYANYYKSATRYDMSPELQAWIKKNPKERYTEGIDFVLWYPNKVGEPGCIAIPMIYSSGEDYAATVTSKPVVNEVFADNGEHSHWELIDSTNGKILWTEAEDSTDKGEKGKMDEQLTSMEAHFNVSRDDFN